MGKRTRQMEVWGGEFGSSYTDRNAMTIEEVDALYREEVGRDRMELYESFLGHLDRESMVLEVGTNVGDKLARLQRLGFSRLYGIELQSYAVEISKKRHKGLNVIQGSAFDIPFKDGFFDLVYTAGVLIHISPDDIAEVLNEIYRCSRKYIWGIEYFAESYEEVAYRGHDGLLWKTNFAKLYLDTFPDLRLVKEERLIRKKDDGKMDTMFLLEKIMK